MFSACLFLQKGYGCGPAEEKQWKQRVNDEWRIISTLSNERIVKYHGVQFRRSKSRNHLTANIIMEYCPGKTAAARVCVIFMV
jgi:serine/threonine protein kinase